MPRVLVVSNNPTPYNDALFARLAAEPAVELLVASATSSEPHRQWRLRADKGYAWRVMSGWTLGASTHLNPAVVPLVRRFRPEVAVLSGSYTMPTVPLAALALGRTPWVYWGEELAHVPAGSLRTLARRLARRTVRAADGVLAVGSRAVASYVRAGVERARIADFRYYADTAHFQLSPEARCAARAEVRGTLGLAAGQPVFLYAGQFVARKGVDTLLRALARAHPEAPSAAVVLLGSGPGRGALESLARELGIGERVRFAGFVQPADLPRFFAAADAFVLPSHAEGWGVVVPEAMAAGLPVLASERVNAAADLVRDGESGWRFAAGDHAALAARMVELCATPGRPAEMGAAAREAVRDEAPGPAARRMARLLEAARARQPLAGV